MECGSFADDRSGLCSQAGAERYIWRPGSGRGKMPMRLIEAELDATTFVCVDSSLKAMKIDAKDG